MFKAAGIVALAGIVMPMAGLFASVAVIFRKPPFLQSHTPIWNSKRRQGPEGRGKGKNGSSAADLIRNAQRL